MTSEHNLRYTMGLGGKVRGKSRKRGAEAVCTCGWRGRVNEGGVTAAERLFRAHRKGER